jgi:hypothetical protein
MVTRGPIPRRAPHLLLLASLAFATGCARFHHYQLGDIDSTGGALEPFELQVDETGFNVHDAAAVGRIVVDEEGDKRLSTAEGVISLFQVGHATGDSTFNATWADGLVMQLRERCPSGRLTGVTTVRESTDYPVVSGEIVTIKGYCVR